MLPMIPELETSLVPSGVRCSTSGWSPSHHTRSVKERHWMPPVQSGPEVNAS